MEPADFTMLLQRWEQGDRIALDALTPVVYRELRRLAEGKLRDERPGHTLQPTALVHEAYLKLVEHDQQHWHSRAHFLSVASHLMREVLVDYARKHRAAKRGSGKVMSLDEDLVYAHEKAQIFVDLDDALKELASFDERKAKLLELKYFGGLSGKEIAPILDISISTITRETRLAEAWLLRYLSAAKENPEP